MKHHFLLLRHCVRSTGESVSVGNHYPHHLQDYIEDDIPAWNVPSMMCTAQGMSLTEKQGAWLVNADIITANTSVEFISDDYTRDVDTSYMLSGGILEALEESNDDDARSLYKNVEGADVIRVKPWLFAPDAGGICSYGDDEENAEQTQERFDTLPRPDWSVSHALHEIEKLAGKGSAVGKDTTLADYLPDESFQHNDEWISGPISFIDHFAETLFFSKAGLPEEKQTMAVDATVHQVYRLLQFHHWYRSVLNVNNNWAAMAGAKWAQVAIQVLERGTLYGACVPETQNTVTILAGHDTDLNTLATALGVTWDLPEYQTHPDLLPTPPGSGIHLVRDTITNKVDVSFVYPVYHSEDDDDDNANDLEWETNLSGVMKEVPVLWKQDGVSTTQSGTISSMKDLEAHLSRHLSKYHQGATDCFQALAREFEESLPQCTKEFANTQGAFPPTSSPSLKYWTWTSIGMAILVTCGLALFLLRKQRVSRRHGKDPTENNERGSMVYSKKYSDASTDTLNSSGEYV